MVRRACDEKLSAFLELLSRSPVKGRRNPRYLSVAKKTAAFRSGNFCKEKDKKGKARKRPLPYRRDKGDKYATPDSTRGHIGDGALRADHRRMFMLCRTARASNVLIARFT